MILGVALIGISVLAVGGGWGLTIAAVGLVPLVTGLVGWCSIYAIIRRGTKSEVQDGSAKSRYGRVRCRRDAPR